MDWIGALNMRYPHVSLCKLFILKCPQPLLLPLPVTEIVPEVLHLFFRVLQAPLRCLIPPPSLFKSLQRAFEQRL